MSTNFAQPYQAEKFQLSIAGDFGQFFTDTKAPVFYVNTSFNINDIGNLKPVREILDVTQVDFEELVQRDLDDFRIRRDIANYLTDGMGYKFFPPIVVALTQPDEEKKAIKKFYPPLKTRVFDDNAYRKFEIEFFDSFCIRWFLDGNDSVISLPAEIKWKNEQTYLMAVDGQHRLVALQAIRGLLANERLKKFYARTSDDKSKLDNLTVPVTILFFPNSVEEIQDADLNNLKKYFPNIEWNIEHRTDVKQVLRNIFVDVNKTARQPSKSRTILLDEKDLTSVFTRKIFSSIKSDLPDIYTAVLEYNSANGKETQIEKNRSIITTIGIVNNICEYLFKDFGQAVDTGANLRTRLGLDATPDLPTSEEFPIENLKATEFSLEQRKACEVQFELKWLETFKKFYTDFDPFKSLIQLVNQTYKDFQEKSVASNITSNDYEAYKVLFGGSEERFILENLAKNPEQTSSKLSLKILKEIEKGIKDNVSDLGMFYTLMFQKGFFETLSELIQNRFFEKDHYLNEAELSKVINQINYFISKNSKYSFFITDTPLYTNIIGGKATPEASRHVKSLLILILLKFGKGDNKFITENSDNAEKIKTLVDRELENIHKRISDLLGKEFESLTENRQKKLEIKAQKEGGADKATTNKAEAEYAYAKSAFIEEKVLPLITDLKKAVNID